MRLPVYVIHWNAPEMLERSLASLVLSEGVDVEITVIDCASEDEALRRASKRAPAQVRIERLERNIGFAGAANHAIALAMEKEAPVMAIAAHDIIVRPETLAVLKRCLDADPTIGIVGPMLMSEDWSTAKPTRGLWFGSGGLDRVLDPGWREHDRFLETDWVTGALLLLRRTCVDEVGGFWTELFAYCEDVDFCLRARDAGWRVGVWTTAFAREPGTTVASTRHVYLITRNALVLTRRRDGRAGFVRGVTWKAVAAGRALGGSIAPWRGAAERSRSRQFFLGQAWGAIDAFRGRLGPGRTFEGKGSSPK
jgi:N-acetylglucosaminyl-diphospho-decaprenol L-rhamnosyltransferase